MPQLEADGKADKVEGKIKTLSRSQGSAEEIRTAAWFSDRDRLPDGRHTSDRDIRISRGT